MSSSNEIRVEVDYNGNTYIRFRNKIYNIFFDSESETGIEITKITDSAQAELANLLEDNSHIVEHAMKGKIVLSDSTLKGRVTQVLSELDPEEMNAETELNMLSANNITFKEERFFTVERADNDDDELVDDWDIMDTIEKYITSNDLEYRFSGIKEFAEQNCDTTDVTDLRFAPDLYFSSILNEMMSHNDTIMIRGSRESKVVTSCAQRTDKFCTRRLVFYSGKGEIKVQFPSSHIIILRMIWNGTDIELKFVNRTLDI